MTMKEVTITARDGTRIGAAIYAPEGSGKYPALLAASPYRATCYQGGIPGQFMPGYWWNQNRIINRFPANGADARWQETDLDALVTSHPTYDDFWKTRNAAERLSEITVPLYSIGIWGKT